MAQAQDISHIYELRVDKLRVVIKEKDDALEAQNAEIFAREEKMLKLQKILRVKENTIKGLEENLRKSQQDSQEIKMQELFSTIQSLQEALRRKDEEIKLKDQGVLSLKSEIQETLGLLAEQENKSKSYKVGQNQALIKVQELENEVKAGHKLLELNEEDKRILEIKVQNCERVLQEALNSHKNLVSSQLEQIQKLNEKIQEGAMSFKQKEKQLDFLKTEVQEERKATQIMKNSFLSEMERLISDREAAQQKYIMKKDSYIMLKEDYHELQMKQEAQLQDVKNLQNKMRFIQGRYQREKQERLFCEKKLETFKRKDRQFLNTLGNSHKNLNMATPSSAGLLLKLQRVQVSLLQANEQKEQTYAKYLKLEKQLEQVVPELTKTKKMLEINSQAYNNCLSKYQKMIQDKSELKKEIQNLKQAVNQSETSKLTLQEENRELRAKISQNLQNPESVIEEVQSLVKMKLSYEAQIRMLREKLEQGSENARNLEESYKAKMDIFECRVKELEEGQRTVLIQKIDGLSKAYQQGRRTSEAKELISQILRKLPSIEQKIMQVDQTEAKRISERLGLSLSKDQNKEQQKIPLLKDINSEKELIALKSGLMLKERELRLAKQNEIRLTERNAYLEKQTRNTSQKCLELSNKIKEFQKELQFLTIDNEKLKISHEFLQSQKQELQDEKSELIRTKDQLLAISNVNAALLKQQRALIETQSVKKFQKISENFEKSTSQGQNKKISQQSLELKIRNANSKAVINSLREKLQCELKKSSKIELKLLEIKNYLKEEDSSKPDALNHEETLNNLLNLLQNVKQPELQLRQQLKLKSIEIQKLKELLEGQQQNFEQLVEAHQELIQKMEESSKNQEQDRQQSLQEIRDKLESLKESEQKFEEQKQKISSELSEQNLELVKEVNQSKKKVKEMIEKNNELEEKVSKLNQKLQLISSSIMKQQQRGNEEEINNLKKQMAQLKESSTLQLENSKLLTQKHKEAKESLKQKEEQYDAFKEKSAEKQLAMKVKISNLEKEVETYSTTIKQLNQGKEDPFDNLVEMFKEKEKQHEANYQQLQEEYQNYKDSVNEEGQEESEEVSEQDAEKEEESEQLNQELERVKQQYREVERQNLVLKKQVSYLSKGTSNEDGQVSIQIKKLLAIINRARRLNEAYQKLFSKKSLLKKRSGIEREEGGEPEKEKRMKID